MSKSTDNEAFARIVQGQLKSAGKYVGEVDGWAGPATQSAYREAAGLVPVPAPIFAPVDSQLLSITATLTGRALGRPGVVAEDGWAVEHTALPLSPEERKARREETLALLGAGLIGRAEARARALDEDLDTATAALPAATEPT
jgi:peptidoglycan hydrolase-like protein with peptidoglycan-binding domain